MKSIKIFFNILLLLTTALQIHSQTINGTVYELVDKKEKPLFGANVYWLNTTVGTTTDANGKFELKRDGITDHRLVASFIGFISDTVMAHETNNIKVVLQSTIILKEVNVVSEREATMISSLKTLKTEMITSKELKKAACCNLGESFETNATVDVTIKDAISGSKEIQVMGLSGGYTQMLTENAPLINGLGLTYGLNSIPGTQIDAINIVKGPGSVIFGHESISGMINIDLKDPETTDKIFINGYLDNNLRKEINADKTFRLNENLNTLLSIHADHLDMTVDENKDGFLDMPLLTTISVLNKWKLRSKKGWMSQNSLKYLYEERMGGEKDFDFKKDFADTTSYGQKLTTNRIEFYGRTGYVIPSAKYKSIGLQYTLVNHEQKGFFGLKKYDGLQQTANLRLIYNQEWNKNNSFNLGVSYKIDEISEQINNSNYLKNENYPGIFLENTFQKDKIISFVLGVRADYFKDKFFITPRGNFKYSISENTDVRASVGTGWRTYNMFAENPNILASSRQVIILEKIEPEEALNFGVNLNHKFKLFYRKGSFGLDVYRTVFTNKIVPDYNTNPTQVIFTNLQGQSFSDNVQTELSWKIFKTIELKTAYKFLDVYSISSGKRIQQPLIPQHRAFANMVFESFNKKWLANVTMQWYGEKKLPNTENNPEQYRQSKFSNPYFVFNALAGRTFKKFEVYLGMDNILDFRQKNPIISADNPYGSYFDTSFIWGPLEGRKIYAGFRFKISRKEN